MSVPDHELTHRVGNFSVLLSPTPRSARLARLLARRHLRGWGLPSDPAELIVAELATNAATHGRVTGRDFRLALHVVADTLRIEVTDTRADRLPHLAPPPAPDAESGRGLLLVEALADRWGVARGPYPRKTVWAELTVRTGEPEACEIDRIVDGRMTNRAVGVPFEDVLRETRERRE
ncbi:ATP-binding protein [Streptomyces calvus]